jgi:predicted nucleotidyltransferase
LRELAQRVADSLPPVAEDVVLTGSTSRGAADELSDVELLVVSEALPSLEECLAATGFEDHWTPDGTLWWTGGVVDGEEVEAIWWPRERVERRIDDILAAEVFDHQRLRTAEAIAHGVALRGERLAEWQQRLAAYPDDLARHVIDDAAESWHESPRSERALMRDRLPLARRLVEDAENVLRIVFALNREWEPGWKRIDAFLEPLPVKPARLVQRIDAALEAHDLRAMRELVRDALALAPDTPNVLRARREVDAFLA